MPPRVSRREQKRIKRLEQKRKAPNTTGKGRQDKRRHTPQHTAPGTMEAMHEKIHLYALTHGVSVGKAKRMLGLKHQKRG
ncbi:MAG: hypothetical protein J4224_00215 [Candidatus Diapherotrites archaeon]|uniref:Uncharacterized protein n=1 Tax=Candidatus Iainarchaeum sp. TaxID=3101447 RepID=A0A7J4IVZ8_9ARCH|nr:MAG: hypothetical protein QT03_C0001G1080 [archaeon GW2011_AR10]MBS3058834.1 hypothetical protein [Candidatus Diapherotrites archaeon]HIH07897.1 hypothetical protein [Candidatus Diapherotrites archaeon]